jgi:signal transduction histidine kinase/DNA-binding response OmpR family regulator
MKNGIRSQDELTRSLAAALVPSDLPPVNILIVDDEPRNLTVLETVLDDPGYRLVRATSPEQALLALVNEEFALLILDVQMPGMTGFELAQTIKTRKKTSQIPIIFLTAHFNDDAHVLEGYGTGAVDYLLKPVNAAALRSKVAVFTELHRRGRDLALANRALAAEVVERTRAEDEVRLWNKQLDLRVAERTSALEASSARLRLATDAAGLGFWLWNLELDTWSWENDWPAKVLGLAQEQWPGTPKDLQRMMEPGDAARFGAALAETARHLGRLRFEGRLLGASGKGRTVEIDGRLVEGGNERRTVLGTIRDVSERHEAEREVRESESRYRALFHSIDEGFCVVDMVFDAEGVATDLRFRETNGAFHRHSGLGDVVGRLASAVLPGLERVWLDGLGKVASEGLSFRHTGRIETLARIVDIHAFRIGADEKRSVALLFRDVTEHKRSEEALLERERFLSTVTEAARVGIAVIDSSYRYRFVNESFQRMLKVARPISVGTLGGSVNPRRWQQVKASIDRALAGERLSIEFTIPPSPDSGSDQATHVCAFLEPHTDANQARTVAVVLLDITNLKQLEAELRDADRHKDEFLATLAHELRNPLAPVRNAVSILQLSAVEDSGAQRAAAIIERQVKIMARLIDDLMDVARVNQGRMELRLANVRLDEVIHLAIEASRPQIDDLGHRLEVDLPAGLPVVHADVVRLAQVFMNILTNAAKYTERGGLIVLRARATPDEVHITIRDTGIGIAPDNLERVFEMFSQVEVALARSRGGLGIGLSLAKRLVELHGGTITASSAGLGHGSEFEVALPVVPSAPVESTGSPPPAEPARASLRILVVDDNQDGAESLAALLQMRGFTVSTAFDGEQAVAIAESFRPDLVLLDIGLPKLNGYEVCRAIKTQAWASGTRIIAITGWGDPKSRQAATDAGFDRHFVKPISNDQLLTTIREMSAERR